ncbi:MAG: CHAT domain-containing protein, partial [Anaerolineae bacterium]
MRGDDYATRLRGIANQLEGMGYQQQALFCRLDALIKPFVTDPTNDDLLAELESIMQSLQSALGPRATALVLRMHRAYALQDYTALTDLVDRLDTLTATHQLVAYRYFVHRFRALVRHAQGQLDEALHIIKQAVEEMRALAHPVYLTNALLDQAYLYQAHGDIAAAEQSLNKAVTSAEGSGFLLQQAEIARRIGESYLQQGSLQAAEQRFVFAEEVYGHLGQQVQLATTVVHRASVYRQWNQLGLAFEALNYCHEVLDERDHYWVRATAYAEQAAIYRMIGELAEEQIYLQRSIDTMERSGAQLYAFPEYLQMARVLHAQIRANPDTKSLADFQVAWERIALVEEMTTGPSPQEVLPLIRLTQGELKLSEARWLQLHERKGVEHSAREALAFFAEASEHFERLGQETNVMHARLGSAQTLLLLGELARAEQVLESLHGEIPIATEEQIALLRGALAYSREEMLDALDYYEQALSLSRRARRSVDDSQYAGMLAENRQDAYQDAFSLAVAYEYPERALRVAELYNGAGIPSSDDLLDLVERTRRRLNAVLNERWTVVRYVESPLGLAAFVIAPDYFDLIWCDVADEDRMNIHVLAHNPLSFRRRAYGDYPEMIAARQSAYEMLLPPQVRERLTPDHLLVIVPTGHLHALPFAALLNAHEEPLVLETAIHYAPSLAGLLRHDVRPREPNWRQAAALVIAQSRFPAWDGSVPALPHAHDEAHIVHGYLNHQTQVMDALHNLDLMRLVDEAHFGSLREMDLLHIITHTAFRPHENVGFDSLLLNDRSIYTGTIRQWDLAAWLAVLSGCQTSLDQQYTGDERMNVAMAFLQAGVSTVMASLWPVFDRQSVDFIDLFYKHLLRGSRPAMALAAAQREAVNTQGLTTFDWAAFGVYGLV